MAEDQWHHLEGTYPEPGLFRAYFYDNFTKPLAVAGFSGTVAVLDANGNETASVLLRPGPIANTLEARLQAASVPLKAAAKVKFGAGGKEQRFDFAFSDYSQDPSAVPANTTGTARAGRAQSVSAKASAGSVSAPAIPAPGPAPAAPAGQPSPSTAVAPSAPTVAAAPASPPSPFVDLSQTPPALAEALDESRLPPSPSGLVTQLATRSKEIEDLLHQGNLGQVWLPAMAVKTVALALDAKSGVLPAAARATATSAVDRVVTAAWQLDAYGDLGNRAKIDEAYGRLSAAVAQLQSLYAGRQQP
jgi:hypothetical protein